ncbi:hypothetical protein GOBAR_AA35309 [Gossypium barbadense]|uniref:Uncharacterized protein n=1 Tax=Gossypium barbadense TaxID=3634 RepID=A0A2P5W2Q9_GOSBA|nr:hypothetical protein GOBAR_AA35309 [Gossypium barbadense]
MVNEEYRPRVPYPNATRKDRSDEQFGELTLRVGDETVTLQARNSGITSNIEDPHIVTTTPNEEIPFTVLSIFPFGTVQVSHPKFGTFKAWEKRTKLDTNVQHGRLVIIHCMINPVVRKLHTHDFTMLILMIFPCQYLSAYIGRSFERRMKYMLSVATYISLSRSAGTFWPLARPRTILAVPSTISSSRGKKIAVPASKERKGASSFAGPIAKIHHPLLQFPRGTQEELFQILQARPLIANCGIDWATVEQVQMADAIRALLTTDPWELFFRIIKLTYLELTMELCSTSHDYRKVREHWRHQHSRRLLLMVHVARDIIDLTYFIALAIQHQTEQHQKGVISIGPYVTRLARHFGLLNTAAQESSLTLIGQMSPQGISSMLSMRMIERRRGTYPP